MEQKPVWLNTKGKKLPGLVLLLLGIGTAIIAQYTLLLSTKDLTEFFVISHWWNNTWNNTSPIPGVLLYILASIFFVFGVHFLGDVHKTFPIYTEKMQKHIPKFGFWVTSFGLAIIIAIHASQTAPEDPSGFAFATLWLLSIILFVLSVLLAEGWRPAPAQERLAWFKKHRTELFVIATILATAFFIRFLDLEMHPYSFINDEAQMGINGTCIMDGTCSNFFYAGWAQQTRFNFLPYGISVGLLGRTAFAVRIISVITGTLSVLAVYLFAREVFNSKIAWLSALLLTILPVHIQFSRTGVGNIVDSLSAPVILWLLFRGARRGSMLSFLAAGIVSGFCLYIYPGSLLAPVLGMGALAYIAIRTPGFIQAHFRRLLYFILIIIVVALPIMGFYATNGKMFLGRLKGEGIFQNGSLQREVQETGKSPVEILVRQFARSSLVYIASNAPVNFFNSPKPYLPPAEAVLFVLGMAYVLWRIKDLRYLVIFTWFWAVVILGSMLTSSPPSNQRLLMSTPALAIIVAIGMTKTLGAFSKLSQHFHRFVPLILLGLILYIGYTNLNFYFGEYRIGHYIEDVTNELTYETATYIAPLHTQGVLYLISDPGVPYLSFPSFDFFAPDVEKIDFNSVTRETLAVLPRDKDALFIATPDFKSDLEHIAQWIPGGEWTEFKRRYQPEYMLFYSYKITKAQLEGFKP